MKVILHRWWLAWFVSLSTALATDLLPLCPTNLQYFPQKLPLHCRMPGSVNEAPPELPKFPTLPPLPDSGYYRSLPSDKQPPPIPIPIPPFPGMPGAMPMPGPMGPMPVMPGAMPMPMPMPVPMVGGPPHKLPVIVMPFYSQDHSVKKPRTEKPRKQKKRPRKKRKYHHSTTDTDSSSSTSCSTSSCSSSSSSPSSSSETSDTSFGEHGWWKGRRSARKKMTRRSNRPHAHRKKKNKLKNKKKDILTPILQYVTKDGYVIFEKKISKGEAKDWLKELKPRSEMTEHKEVKSETNREEKPPDEYVFNPKSAEEFFKIDEASRLKANEIDTKAAPIEVTTRKGKRKHRPLKFNPVVKTE